MKSDKRRRLRAIEQQLWGAEIVVGAVNVCDLSEEEAAACIAAKQAELDLPGRRTALIVFTYATAEEPSREID